MSNKRPGGFTLIEMIIAIVIIGVGLAGVLSAVSTTVKSSADPLVYKQMLTVAEEMMEEIMLKPYAVGTGTITGCDRSAADDVRDYGAYTDQPVCDIDGTAVGHLAGYTVSVTTAADAAFGDPPAADARRIVVTVKRGGDELVLTSWRTDYATP